MKQKGSREQSPPGTRHNETTRDERMKVITLRDEMGMGWSEIGRRLGIDRRTCQKIYQRSKASGTLSNRKRSGRPPIFDDAEKKRLVEFVTRDSGTRELSSEAIRFEMNYNCSPKTVRNVMASMGYHKRVPRHKSQDLEAVVEAGDGAKPC